LRFGTGACTLPTIAMGKDSFATRLRATRQARGFSLEGLAKRTDVSKTHLQRWETGFTKNPSARKLDGVAGVLGVSPEWLMYGDTPPKRVAHLSADREAVWTEYVQGPVGSKATRAEREHQRAGFELQPPGATMDVPYLEAWLLFMRARLSPSQIRAVADLNRDIDAGTAAPKPRKRARKNTPRKG